MDHVKESVGKEKRTMAIERDRMIAKRMIQYLLFYLCVIFVLSLVSFLLDSVFFKLNTGSTEGIRYLPIEYFPYYMIFGYWIFPASLLYNYLINKYQPLNLFIRALSCIVLFLVLCYAIDDKYEFGYYIRDDRAFKNVLVVVLSGFIIELIRDQIVKFRLKKVSD